MDRKLEQKLFKKYPKLFVQKNLSMKETCMCWGINTGNGWEQIIENVCDCIQSSTDSNPEQTGQVEFIQVKEKFAGLRMYYSIKFLTKQEFNKSKIAKELSGRLWCRYNKFLLFVNWINKKLFNNYSLEYKLYRQYISDFSEWVDGVISLAESFSYKTCDICGKPGRVVGKQWVATRCKEHERK